MTQEALLEQGFECLAGPYHKSEAEMLHKAITQLKGSNTHYELLSTEEGKEIWTIPKHSFAKGKFEAEATD
jgi:hypothetical protein